MIYDISIFLPDVPVASDDNDSATTCDSYGADTGWRKVRPTGIFVRNVLEIFLMQSVTLWLTHVKPQRSKDVKREQKIFEQGPEGPSNIEKRFVRN